MNERVFCHSALSRITVVVGIWITTVIMALLYPILYLEIHHLLELQETEWKLLKIGGYVYITQKKSTAVHLFQKINYFLQILMMSS